MEEENRPISVLMVEDDPAVRESITWLLEEEGYRVHIATDGADALRRLNEIERVDIVLSDVNMPVMDGIELSRRLYDASPTLPVLLMSGRRPPDVGRRFLPKPFRLEALREAIHQLVAPRAMAAV